MLVCLLVILFKNFGTILHDKHCKSVMFHTKIEIIEL